MTALFYKAFNIIRINLMLITLIGLKGLIIFQNRVNQTRLNSCFYSYQLPRRINSLTSFTCLLKRNS